MSELKTPYLDKEIEDLKWLDYGGVQTISERDKWHEYQSIKEALKRLKRLEEIKSAAEITVKAISTNPAFLFNEIDNLKNVLDNEM